MKGAEAEFDFADILPIAKMDEDLIEVEATVFNLRDYARAAGFLLLVTGALIAIATKGQINDLYVVGMILFGVLVLVFIKKPESPLLIFRKGSREIRIRRGTAETALNLNPEPFEVYTTVAKGPKLRTIQILCRDKKGAQIWCHGFPPVEQVAAIAAFLEAFIQGEDPPSLAHILRIKIS